MDRTKGRTVPAPRLLNRRWRNGQFPPLSWLNRSLPLLGVIGLGFVSHTAAAQSFCIDVQRIDLVGISLIDAPAQAALTAPFVGQCLGLPQIDALLQAVTLAYVDLGFIAARAYLPEQNLADGQLEIRVIEGSLARIEMNGKEQPRWQARVFPGLVGRPVNLREIEQGLDVIRSMPGYGAEIELVPGVENGTSVLEVTAETARPWTFRLSTNNHGLENEDPGQTVATGQFITSANMTWSHLMGMNETWSLAVSKSIRDTPFDLAYDGPGTRSLDLGLTLPYGPWRLDLGLGYSDYATTTPGAISDIPVDGDTLTAFFGIERLMHRDQTSKTWIGARLSRRDSENRIAGAVIDVSSQVITALRLSARHERALAGGQLGLSGGFERGLDFLGAEDASEQPTGSPDAQYSLVDFSVSYARPFKVGSQTFGWQSDVRGQYSPDRLYSSQQFGLGSFSTVRGAREQLIVGSSGVVLRNELRWDAPMEASPVYGQLQLYGGVDLGWIAGQTAIGVNEGGVSGAVVGLRSLGGPLSLDLSYAEILSTPNGISRPDGVVLVSASWQF